MKTLNVIPVLLLLWSCDAGDYTFYVENKSRFHLDSAKIGGYPEQSYNLAPGAITGPFRGKCAPVFTLVEPGIGLFVTAYSDGVRQYQNHYGTFHSMSQIKNNGTYIFSIHESHRDSLGRSFYLEITPTDDPFIASRKGQLVGNERF
jgi:hypothetical protein